jgi:putative ABC transport system permease protein
MVLIRHAVRLVLREPRRTVTSALGVSIAAALLVSVVLFGTASGATLTRRALATLPIDAQALLAAGADNAAAAALVSADPAVTGVLPFDLIHFDSASLTKSGAATQTGVGVVVGVGPTYTAATGLFRVSQGAAAPGSVTISRDLATNLGAIPGDKLTLHLPGGATMHLPVSGIVDITGADLLLGPTDAAHRAAGANPPTNVAVTDLATSRAILAKIPAGATATDPATTGGAPTGGSAVVVAPEPAVRQEIQVRYDHAQLPGDPSSAQPWLDQVRRRIERQAAGSLTMIDDAGATLEPVANDLAWGQVLFIFLGLPGVALALVLSRSAAESGAEATRRHAALLRARGASFRQLLGVFLGATAMTAALGSIVGAVIGLGLAAGLFGAELAATNAVSAVGFAIVLTIAATTLLATLAAALPIRDQLRHEVAAGRQELQRVRQPLWQRLYLDVVALASAVIVWILVGGSGVHPVLNVEGNPTVSLALTSFAAPFLLWVGGTLGLLRLVGFATARSDRLAGILRRPLGAGGEIAGRSFAARSGAASRAIVLLALAFSFAASVLIFDATYRQQQHVDAALTLGADLRATSATPVDAAAVSVVAGPGVVAATPFSDRVVYVGSEAQDLLAIDPATLAATAPLADGFFQGTSAKAAMAALSAQPDAILVSAETAKDYSIVSGDRLRIRVPDVHGQLHDVDFHMAGVALEFPTAPKDAFLVANLAYLAAQTGDGRITSVLARSDGSSTAALRDRLGTGWTVTDIGSTTARLANSVTSVDLQALVGIDVGFAVLIASLGLALFLLAGLSERRRELATFLAIGADPGQMRAAITGEAGVVGVAGLTAGLVTGVLVGYTLLAILAGVFDPPADLPVVPVAAIAAVGLAVVAGLAVAVIVAGQGLSRIGVIAALRER